MELAVQTVISRADPAVKLKLAFKLNSAHASLAEFIESYGVNHKQTLKTWLGWRLQATEMIFKDQIFILKSQELTSLH